MDFIQLVAKLFVDTGFSWIRMSLALVLSILFSWVVGIAAARNNTASSIIIPVLDVLQSVPILGFFPIVLVVFVAYFPGWLGVNLAVIFLIFTSMSWNIAFAVYEAVLSIPQEYLDLACIEKWGLWTRVTQLYISASWSKVAYNAAVSWSVGLFYLVSSEIFALGTTNYHVANGIGVDIATYSSEGAWGAYATALGVLIVAVILTRFFFLGEFSAWSEKFKIIEEPTIVRKDPIYRFYSWINTRASSRVFVRFQRPSARPQTSKRTDERAPPKPVAKPHDTRLIKVLGAAIGLAIVASIVFEIFSSLAASGITVAILWSKELTVLNGLLYSFARVWYVYGVAAVIGLPLGIVIASHPKIYQSGSAALQVISSIPAVALLPPIAIALAALPFSGELTAAIVIFLGTVWYIIFNVMAGIRSIPNEIFEASKLMGLKGWAYWKNVLIPASLPSFVTGSITGIGAAWNTLVIAEYFSVSGKVVTRVGNGIGVLLNIAINTNDLLLMGLTIVSMSALIVVVNLLFWRRLYKYTTKRFAYRR